MTCNYVLAVDIGTSSVRAMVFDANGKIHARDQICYSTIRPAPYYEEQDPDFVREEVFRAITNCLNQNSSLPGKIGAISFSSQMYGVIALDQNNKPLTRNILWSDGRAQAQAAHMKQRDETNALYRETGCPMNSIFPISKIVWLRENDAGCFKNTARFVSIKEYVAHSLIGKWVVDYSMASATGMFDIRKKTWSKDALEITGIKEAQLSRPVSGIECFDLQKDSPLSNMDLRPKIKVLMGGGDGPLANLGSGASFKGAVNIDLGTSGAARCITDEATVDETASLWCFCLTDDIWAYGGIVTNVGNAYQWLGSTLINEKDLSDTEIFQKLNMLAEEASAGSEGLYFLPYLRKARSPYWDDRLKGTVFGLTPDHKRSHIARALLEAVAYDLRAIIDIMKKRTEIGSHIVLTGGLSRSPIIPQLLADVLNIEIRTPEEGEGSIAGAAILGLYGIGVLQKLAFSNTDAAYKSFLPDKQRVAIYERSYQGYVRLIAALREINLNDGGI